MNERKAGEFSVYQYFPDRCYEQFLQRVDAETAVLGAKGLTESVGAKLGTTQRVIITDGDDCICFDWKHGEGIVFPPPDVLWPPASEHAP